MNINVLLFAAAKEKAGSDIVSIELPEPACAADVLRALESASPALAPLLCSCRVAVDCCYAAADDPVAPNSEVALIPPVSGG